MNNKIEMNNQTVISSINANVPSETALKDLELKSVNEIRKILNVSHHTVIKLILSGQLHAVKINTRYKIPPTMVKNYIESISKYEKINNEESIVPRYNTVSQHDVESVLDRMYKKYSTN